MEKSTEAVRTAQRHDDDPKFPRRWESAQDSLAAESGLALLLVEGHQPPQLHTSNNNSICYSFQTSTAHAHLCDPYCGEAHRRAREAGEPSYYRCHAGLQCFAAPVELKKGKRLAVIGGRAFISTADYRALVERFRTGDLRDLLSPELFRNVLFATNLELERLAARVREAAAELAGDSRANGTEAPEESAARGDEPRDEEALASELFPWGVGLEEACSRVAEAIAAAHDLCSVAVYLRREDVLIPVSATGGFKVEAPRVSLRAKGRDAKRGARPPSSRARGGDWFEFDEKEVLRVFPLAVGDEVKGAVAVAGGGTLAPAGAEKIADYCEKIAAPFELLSLREELERRMRVAYHLQSFTEKINSVDPGEAYAAILRHSTELLRSERGSLLLFDEAANELQVKAAVGPRAKAARDARVPMGEGISGTALREGRPLVVRDLGAAGHSPAPAERKYKTGSFISYPLIVGSRRVGVLNMTDKVGDGVYDDLDLNLLDMFAPQMALALDRAEWHQKATQFQLLSITDALTGLLNRRYLEERLGEELERSKRHRFPMSFLMIDIDNFKEYNDSNGHQAGDVALEVTAQCLKSALRSEDVASRYGGEEFSILLPQTSLAEAHVIAERIRRRVERTSFEHRESQPGGAVTVSIGISSFAPKVDTPEGIIGAADQALYLAKSRGKNRIEAYSPPALNTPS
ncbi:MAG TPA: diguanylate cyclase [Pyrinomonadaceae bacterium]|jgi:diguanylate cyclase (GGDEF)-like protein